MSFKEVNTLRKEGRLQEASDIARKDLDEERNYWSLSAAFWVSRDIFEEELKHGGDKASLWDKMQECAAYLKELQDSQPSKDFDLTISTEALGWSIQHYLKLFYERLGSEKSRRLLISYLRLGTARPSLLHSQILFLALRIAEKYQDFKFHIFLRMWGLDNFRPEDWKRSQDNERHISYLSLVEKVITQYEKSLSASGEAHGNKDEQFLKDAIKRYADKPLLRRYLAKLFLSTGRKDEAVAEYRAILKISSDFYIWQELANITDDRSLSLSALCKAILSKTKDDYLGVVRLDLAKMFIEDKSFDRALYELNAYENTYSKNGWPLKERYKKLRELIPDDVSSVKSNTDFYKSHLEEAEAFVFNDLPWTEMVVTDIYKRKRKDGSSEEVASLVSGDSVSVSARVQSLPVPLQTGQVFRVKLRKSGERMSVIKAEMIEAGADIVKVFRGKIHIKQNAKGNPFGFVGGCYVPEKLLSGTKDGETVSVNAIRGKGKWRAFMRL